MKRFVSIIEDEQEIGESLSMFLRSKKFDVKHYLSAEDFFSDRSAEPQAIYLVDWNLPGIKGIDIIKTIRKRDKLSPIFMLSAYSKNQEIVEGLKAGADDYLTKPFDFDALAVRIENAWTKISGIEGDLVSHGLRLIPEAHSVMKNGVTVSLTAREYVIFARLYNTADTVNREELIKEFDQSEKMTVRNIDVHIFFLRKKLAKIDMAVTTVWGKGYKLLTESTAAVEA
ncbi:MAG: response regulator transcription factor [Bacteriovoracaceae bacterium]|nr:response regulator transcription factor [Bacteriovoracaceae bacterium]